MYRLLVFFTRHGHPNTVTAISTGPCCQSKAYLLRVHGGCAKGVDDYHVWSSVGVVEIASIALPQAVHHTGFIQIKQ